MVKTRHPRREGIRPVRWRPSDPRAQIELLRLTELRPRLNRSTERLEFYGFLLVTRGACVHEVDFQRFACRPGTLVHVRPGQLQRWRAEADVDGMLLIFEPSFLFTTTRRAGFDADDLGFDERAWPTRVQLDHDGGAAAEDWMRRIERALAQSAGSALGKPLVRHLVSAALIDLARRQPFAATPPSEERERVRRFEDDIERSFRVTRNVGDYAARWGVSERTLDRLSREAFGMSAKQKIDARVVLEARRLLAHTELPVAEIGDSLGFSEATNFGKFFETRTGERPGAFRERQRR